jgi:hypothetical protein
MTSRISTAIAALTLVMIPIGLAGQVTLQPTPPPVVTAENEPWFQAREPLVFAGNIYYPAGPQVFFNRSEMVRSGFYGAIPLYTKTTVEPFSTVYVPLPGGVMQPYERRRAGELAGTVGSTVPSFPVATPYQPSGERVEGPQAAGPPTNIGAIPMAYAVPIESMLGTQAPSVATPDDRAGVASTSGTVAPGARVQLSAAKPLGLNAVYIQYAGRTWYSAGRAVSIQSLDQSSLRKIGAYHGFPVYARDSDVRTIYISVAPSAGELLAPFSLGPLVQR